MPDATRRLVIIGAGGHGLEVLWVAARMSLEPKFGAWNVLGFVDDRLSMRGRMIEGLPVLGSVSEFLEIYRGQPLYFHCAVGNNLRRQKLSELLESQGFQPATLIDPMTIVSPRAIIEPGAYIAPRCYVGPSAHIGRYALINVAASIGHHSTMGDFSQACPGVRVNGHSTVEKLAFLGSNAVIHPGKRVGHNATVAACSFVVRDVKPNALVIGVPAVTVDFASAFSEKNVDDESADVPESSANTPPP